MLDVKSPFLLCPIPRPKLLENTDKMGHAFLDVLYAVLKYFTIIKVEK